MPKGYLCKDNGKNKGCGKRHTRYCRAYKSCKAFVAIAKKGGNVRDMRNKHMHLCNGAEIWENALIDYFSISV